MSVYDGYGYEVDLDRITVESLENLVSYFPKAKELYKKAYDFFETHKFFTKDVDGIDDVLRDDLYQGGVNGLVAVCLNSALNYDNLFYDLFDDDGKYVMMTNFFTPWDIPEEYLKLKAEDVSEAFNRIFRILYNDPNFNEPLYEIEVIEDDEEDNEEDDD